MSRIVKVYSAMHVFCCEELKNHWENNKIYDKEGRLFSTNSDIHLNFCPFCGEKLR